MSPLEVHEHITLLWAHENKVLKYLFGSIYVDENTIENSKKGYEL